MGSEISRRSKRSDPWGSGERTAMVMLLGGQGEGQGKGGKEWEMGGKAWACSREGECLIQISKVKI